MTFVMFAFGKMIRSKLINLHSAVAQILFRLNKPRYIFGGLALVINYTSVWYESRCQKKYLQKNDLHLRQN